MPEENKNIDTSKKGSSRFWLILIILAVVLAGFAAWGIFSRVHHTRQLKKQTQKSSILVVNVIQPKELSRGGDIVLPGTIQAWHEASLSARVSGYLKAWHKDIGDHVRAGDLLAEIDTPETDRQLQQAEADLAMAIANSDLAKVTADRWVQVVGTHAVSQQETDEKVADARAKAATVLSQTANRDRLRELESFKRIIAPFEGIVTNRTTDIGALISQNGPELYHIAATQRLRIYVNIPEVYTSSLPRDVTAELRFTEHPSEVFIARLLSTARAIDPVSRTLLAQFVLDNADGRIFPGGFAEVHLKSPQGGHPTLRLPVNAFLFQNDGLQVAVVGQDNKIKLQKVTPGRDFGQSLEIIAGLSPEDKVVLSPPDSLYQDEEVRIAQAAPQDGGKQEQEAKEAAKNKPKDKDEEKSDKDSGDNKKQGKPEDGKSSQQKDTGQKDNGQKDKAQKDKGGSEQQQGGIQTDPSLQDENSRSYESAAPEQSGSGDDNKKGKKKQKSDDPNIRDDAQ